MIKYHQDQGVAITNNRWEQTTGNPGLAGTRRINYGKSQGSGNRETMTKMVNKKLDK